MFSFLLLENVENKFKKKKERERERERDREISLRYISSQIMSVLNGKKNLS